MWYEISARKSSIPPYGVVALIICLASWTGSWLHIEPFSQYSFFPLWCSYIFFLDALVVWRSGTSLLVRARWRYALLFIASSLFWWIFEGFNAIVQNWHYQHHYGPIAYFLMTFLSFSTPLPAVLETAELLSTFRSMRSSLPVAHLGERARLSLTTLILIEVAGIVSFFLVWIFPQYCFWLVWLCLLFVLEPINFWFGRKSVLAYAARRNWQILTLPLAGLVCGFFWEMWNYYAFPKWYYTIPFVGFWKIFEMPLLGYTGYLPFALELFALYQFALLLARQPHDYLNL